MNTTDQLDIIINEIYEHLDRIDSLLTTLSQTITTHHTEPTA